MHLKNKFHPILFRCRIRTIVNIYHCILAHVNRTIGRHGQSKKFGKYFVINYSMFKEKHYQIMARSTKTNTVYSEIILWIYIILLIFFMFNLI